MVRKTHQLSLDLVLELGTEPIAGRIVDELGREIVFAGWLDLASGLERLRERAELLAPHVGGHEEAA